MVNLVADPSETAHKRVTLNLRQDNRGYYWQPTGGKATEIRFADVEDALDAVIAKWSSGCTSNGRL